MTKKNDDIISVAMADKLLMVKRGGWLRLFRMMGLFGGVQAVGLLASLVRNKCAAVWLGPSGMGVVALLSALVALLSQVAGMGLTQSAVRQLSLAHGRGQSAWVRMVGVVRSLELGGCLLALLLCGMINQWVLSLAVMAAVVTGGEMAILKAAGRVRWLAFVQLVAIAISLVATLPLYIMFGVRAVVAVIVVSAWGAMVPVICCSWRLCPLSWERCSCWWQEMGAMLRLSVAFTLASLVGTASEYVVRWWLEQEAGLSVVGIFSSAQMLMMGVMTMLFSALEQDYLPRLSSLTNRHAAVRLVRKQLVVMAAVALPLMLVACVVLPWVVPLLFSADFLPMVPLARWWALAMVFKALTMPVAYMTLARGRSVSYFLLELAYYVVYLLALIVGYRYGGLWGLGIGIVVAHGFDLAMIYAYARFAFGFFAEGIERG